MYCIYIKNYTLRFIKMNNKDLQHRGGSYVFVKENQDITVRVLRIV